MREIELERPNEDEINTSYFMLDMFIANLQQFGVDAFDDWRVDTPECKMHFLGRGNWLRFELVDGEWTHRFIKYVGE